MNKFVNICRDLIEILGEIIVYNTPEMKASIDENQRIKLTIKRVYIWDCTSKHR
jgi:hypothetical protein